MSLSIDMTDWNARYRSDMGNELSSPRDWLVEHADLLPSSGVAFEAAIGRGDTAGFLSGRGFQVIGVELSSVAAKQACRLHPDIQVVIGDLSRFRLPVCTFDLICDFYFLDRTLLNQFANAIKPGGMVIMETLTIQMLSCNPDIIPERLLQPGELSAAFSGWEIMDYREGWVTSPRGHQKAIASIVARAS